MFKRNISLDKKLFEKRSPSNSNKRNLNGGNSLDASKDAPNAGENHVKAAEPSQNAGVEDVGKPPKDPKSDKIDSKSDKIVPNAVTPVENPLILEELNTVNESTPEKPVMIKTMSMSSSTDNDDDTASVSELERSGRRKAKMCSGVSKELYM